MATSLGMLDIGFTADLGGLDAQLNQATSSIQSTLAQMGNAMMKVESQAKTSFNSMKIGAMSIGTGMMSSSLSFIQSTAKISARLLTLGGDMAKAQTFAKNFFNTMKYAAIGIAGAMIAGSEQGKMLGEAMGKLSQFTIDKTIGPTIEQWANGIQRLVTNMQAFGSFEGFERTFSEETKMKIVALSGAITGVLLFALNSMNITLWATASALWAVLAPMIPWMVAGAAIAGVAYLIWQNWGQLMAWFNSAFPGLSTVISVVFTAVVNIVRGALMLIWSIFKTILLGIWLVVSTIFNMILQTIIVVLRGAWSFIRSIFQAIKVAIQAAMSMIKAMIAGDWSTVGQIFSNAMSKILQIGKQLFANLKSAVSEGLSAIKGYFSNIINSIIGIWKGLYGSIAGIWNKISSLWGKSNTMKAEMSVTASQTVKGPGKSYAFAKGGIITQPTMSLMGEGRYAEGVIPLSKSTFKSLADGITANMTSRGGGNSIVIQNMTVREEADITRIAEKLHRLQTIQQRAGGIV